MNNKVITFICKDQDGTFTLQNGWHFLGGWTTSDGNSLKIWKTLSGALKAIRKEFPENAVVFCERVPE